MAKPAGEEKQVALKGSLYRYTLVRRKNQKHINLRVTFDGKLIVSAPAHTEFRRIGETLKRKEGWIVKHILEAKQTLAAVDPLKAVPLNGHTYTIEKNRGNKRPSVTCNDLKRLISIKYIRGGETELLELLGTWLRRRAKKELTARTAELSTAMKVPYTKVYIRDQKTRWGSSSGIGGISLNWRIIMAPKYVQDYLIVHELVHQIHRNHKKPFWNEMEARFPYYREAEAWLKEHSLLFALFRY
jgi:predicted metal-dependent hydrolase